MPYAYSFVANIAYKIEGNTENARKIIKYIENIFPKDDSHKWFEYDMNLHDSKYDKALQHIIDNGDSLHFSQGRITPKERSIGDIYLLMGDKQKARAYYLSAIKTLSRLEGYDTDPRYHASIGLLHALVGDTSIAIKEAKLAIALYPDTKDAFISDWFEMDLARGYSIVGEYDMALDILEELINKPSHVNWMLKYDEIFDTFLGNNLKWKELIRIDEEKFHKEAKYDINSYIPQLFNSISTSRKAN